MKGVTKMPTLDWSQCPAVESVPGRLSGAWVFRNTRMPVSAVFENLEASATIDEIVEQFDIWREQINEVLEFAAAQPRRSSSSAGRLRPRCSFSRRPPFTMPISRTFIGRTMAGFSFCVY
jgi:uncharacterized protein (DUF433 family)